MAGYFAFTAEQIPIVKSGKMAVLFFISGMTPGLSTLAYNLGPSFYFLFYFLPSDSVLSQVAGDNGLTGVTRIEGVAPTCTAALCLLLATYGIRGLFDWSKPWRLLFLCVTIVLSFFGGYRSIILLLFFIFAFQFYFEGLMRTHYLPIVAGLAICGFVPILLFTNKMPTSVQRAVSFLPVNVDSEVLADAKASSEWRFQIWDLVIKDVPKYLLIGKGYGMDPNEIYAVVEAERLGIGGMQIEATIMAGDYHNGPLSILVPFGIFGVIGFLWVLFAGFRLLHANYRFGDARLRQINTLFLSYYLAQCVCFFFIFGAFNSQLSVFLGVCGMSVSLNGGVKRRTVLKLKPLTVPETLMLEPG
jgi:O-antigen ligase